VASVTAEGSPIVEDAVVVQVGVDPPVRQPWLTFILTPSASRSSNFWPSFRGGRQLPEALPVSTWCEVSVTTHLQFAG